MIFYFKISIQCSSNLKKTVQFIEKATTQNFLFFLTLKKKKENHSFFTTQSDCRFSWGSNWPGGLNKKTRQKFSTHAKSDTQIERNYLTN